MVKKILKSRQAQLNNALTMASRLKHFMLATASSSGIPHITVAGKLLYDDLGFLEVFVWPCPVTARNLELNKAIVLVVWDGAEDSGFQVLGSVHETKEYAVLDGYLPDRPQEHIPQVYWRLRVQIERIMEFKHAVHTDEDIDITGER